ncbi:hypothetical protein M3Y94_00201400 [Aphelenchoides besseyi]|nr:hypothetical protein M3Y94_00201400 [Aphelenchoides besseyi]
MEAAMDTWFYSTTAVAIPCGYVASLYLFDRNQFYQNHPQTIKRRFLGVALSTSISFGTTYCLLKWNYENPIEEMGLVISTQSMKHTIISSAILLSIYFGTIVMEVLESGQSYCWSWLSFSAWRQSFTELTWWKHIVVVRGLINFLS